MPFYKRPTYYKKKAGGASTRKKRSYTSYSGRKVRNDGLLAQMYKKLERETTDNTHYLVVASTASIGSGQYTIPLMSTGEGRYYTGASVTITLQGPMTGDVTVDMVVFSTTSEVAKPSYTASEYITLVRDLFKPFKHKLNLHSHGSDRISSRAF